MTDARKLELLAALQDETLKTMREIREELRKLQERLDRLHRDMLDGLRQLSDGIGLHG